MDDMGVKQMKRKWTGEDKASGKLTKFAYGLHLDEKGESSATSVSGLKG